MRSKPSRGLLSAALLFALMLFGPATPHAAGPFTRNDNYDFRGIHQLSVRGNSLDNLITTVTSDADFRLFKLRVRTGTEVGPSGGNWYWLNRVKVDMNNDGTWELNTTTNGAMVNYMYPAPANGVSATQTIRFEFTFLDAASRAYTRTAYTTVTVFATPRVWSNSSNDAFIQLRDEDATAKKPVLLVEGIDAMNQSFPDTYYSLTQGMINGDLYPNGYEVFILNFNQGGADLRTNADAVTRALEAIHQACPDYNIALVGLSMGGVVSRYALAKAEAQGVDHHVGLFVSYDSPQKMAHFSPDLQDWIKSQSASNDAISSLQASLNSTAAKTMLGYSTYDPSHALHDAFYSEMNALNGDGYPHQSFNAAVSNGTVDATWGFESIGRHLATLKIYLNGNGQIIKDVPAVQLDCGTGSMMTNLTMKRYGDLFTVPGLLETYYEFQITFNPVFMPTWSTLDLVGYTIDPVTGDLTSMGQSRFHATALQTTPRMHNDVSTETRTSLLAWLGRMSTVTVNYVLPAGGSVPPDAYQVPVHGSEPITIPDKHVVVNGRYVTYKFDHWDDGSTVHPRRLYASHPGTRTVTMRAYYPPTPSGATWASNQRRISQESDWVGPTSHAVFENGGAIWYLRNRRNAGWEDPRQLSALTATASAPAVATYSWAHADQIQVHVAWLEPGAIMYRSSAADNGVTWNPTVTLPITDDPSTPVLPNPYALLWAEGPGGSAGIYYYKQPGANTSWSPHLVPGTAGNVAMPAVCSSAECEYQLAFIRDGKVLVTGFSDPNVTVFSAPPLACGTPQDVTTTGWTATNPTIASGGGRLFVAWEEASGATRRIAFKERAGGNWSSTAYFTHASHSGSKPSLGVDFSTGRVNLLWQCNDHVERVSRPVSNPTWSAPEYMGAGGAPGVAEWAGTRMDGLWTSPDPTAYSLYLSDLTPCLCGPPLAVTNLAAGFGKTTAAVSWTAPAADGGGATASFELRRSNANITEANYASAEIVATGESFSPGMPHCASFTNLASCTRYYFALKTQDAAGRWSAISNVPTGLTKCGSNSMQVVCDEGGGPLRSSPVLGDEIPLQMALKSPRPNPSRDLMWIEYAIPGSADGEPFEVAVFDVLGRRVKTIADGAATPGNFSTNWRIREEAEAPLQQGIYFVRFTLGKEKQVRTVTILR